MSKASEFAAKRPEGFKGTSTYAEVRPDGYLTVEFSGYPVSQHMTAEDALAFGRWLIATFGES